MSTSSCRRGFTLTAAAVAIGLASGCGDEPAVNAPVARPSSEGPLASCAGFVEYLAALLPGRPLRGPHRQLIRMSGVWRVVVASPHLSFLR